MNITEKFLSLDGEGPSAGELAVFVRFCGCNLRCSWCDTTYSFDTCTETMTPEQIYDYIKSQNVRNVTLTGGEPLIQQGIGELFELLDADEGLCVHVETNGAVNAEEYKNKFRSISFIFDYKLASSGMTDKMCENNLFIADKNDVYKFVIADIADLNAAYEIIKKYNLLSRTRVYLSPVPDRMDASVIAEFMKEKNMVGARLGLQLHKIIWGNKRGV